MTSHFYICGRKSTFFKELWSSNVHQFWNCLWFKHSYLRSPPPWWCWKSWGKLRLKWCCMSGSCWVENPHLWPAGGTNVWWGGRRHESLLTYALVTGKKSTETRVRWGAGKVLSRMSKTVAHWDRCCTFTRVRWTPPPQRECVQPRSCQSAAACYWTD